MIATDSPPQVGMRRLEANHDAALRYVDEPTYRVRRLFMSGSAWLERPAADAGRLVWT